MDTAWPWNGNPTDSWQSAPEQLFPCDRRTFHKFNSAGFAFEVQIILYIHQYLASAISVYFYYNYKAFSCLVPFVTN